MDYEERFGRKMYVNPHKLTQYPKIFARTYWAGHAFDFSEIKEIELLAKNRDLLVQRFNIKSSICSSNIPKYILRAIMVVDEDRKNDKNILDNYGNFLKYRDHTEYFKTKDGNILSVFSLYVSPTDECKKQLYVNNGYHLFEPIYDKHQSTYIKLIEKNKK